MVRQPPFPSPLFPVSSILLVGKIYPIHLLTHHIHSPGRFFASQQLKLVLAYIALNYEIKSLPSRPANLWFINTHGPPLDAKISVRRREGTV
jgi:hypothetical protein